MEDDTTLSDEDIHAAVGLWLSTPHWRKTLDASVDRLTPGALRFTHKELPEKLLKRVADPDTGVSPLAARRFEAEGALREAEYTDRDVDDVDLLDRVAEVMLEHLKIYVDRRMDQVFRPSEDAQRAPARRYAEMPVVAPPMASSTPLISAHVEDWLTAIQQPRADGKKGIPPHHAGQKRVSVRLLSELIGDKPAGSVSREDAAKLRLSMLKLPASHGKGRYVHAHEAIAKAAAGDVRKFSLKTVKRHFSALRGYWEWLRDEKLIPDAPNPFSGHKFPGTSSSKSNRDDWSVRDLERLFKSSDYRSFPWDSAHHWLPLIALHSGLRLEEIVRLRTEEDIIFEGKIPCFKIQVHADGWDPKSEAGEREVPVHSWLLKHGFLRLVEQRRREGSHRLFSDLSARGGAEKLGAMFSRDFSRLKIGLGIGEKTVFHSFRHTFATEVGSGDLADRFIDAVMGHEGGKKSEGTTYRKRVSLTKRLAVVEAFKSPLPLDFLHVPPDPSATSRKRRRPTARPNQHSGA